MAGGASLDCDTASLYGAPLASFLRPVPDSAFPADGSTVAVVSRQTALTGLSEDIRMSEAIVPEPSVPGRCSSSLARRSCRASASSS
jgi:hypothetical protein